MQFSIFVALFGLISGCLAVFRLTWDCLDVGSVGMCGVVGCVGIVGRVELFGSAFFIGWPSLSELMVLTTADNY